jgi:hypothetical protein
MQVKTSNGDYSNSTNQSHEYIQIDILLFILLLVQAYNAFTMQVKTSTGGYSNSTGDYYARSRAPSAQKFMGPQELAQLVLIIISKKKFNLQEEIYGSSIACSDFYPNNNLQEEEERIVFNSL